jgi:hypothetical protein
MVRGEYASKEATPRLNYGLHGCILSLDTSQVTNRA